MIATDKPNPFHILKLPTNATRLEIVERGKELSESADSKEQELLIRWAKEQLLTNSRTRLEYELFEVPETAYDDSEWETFLRVHKKNPADFSTLVKGAVPASLEDVDLPALCNFLLDSMLHIPDADLSAAIDGSPFVPRYGLPLEVRDVIFG